MPCFVSRLVSCRVVSCRASFPKVFLLKVFDPVSRRDWLERGHARGFIIGVTTIHDDTLRDPPGVISGDFLQVEPVS